MIVSPAQLLLAIAEHESLEKTCEALPGLSLDTARKLLKGAAATLQKEPAAASKAKPAAASKHAVVRKPDGSATAVRVFSDGAARGNPGPAGAGAVLTDASGRVLARLGRYLGSQTNNVAEYQGLLLGLRHAQELGAREIEVRADSQLMIRQLQGRYQVKHPGLKPLHAEALRLLGTFQKVQLEHIPREENSLADEMSNRAIDEEMR